MLIWLIILVVERLSEETKSISINNNICNILDIIQTLLILRRGFLNI